MNENEEDEDCEQIMSIFLHQANRNEKKTKQTTPKLKRKLIILAVCYPK